MKRKQLVCYVVVMFGICLLPFAGMLWKDSGESVENRTLAGTPVLKNEEGWNVDFLADAGAFFEDHFAYRQEMVTADAKVRGEIFGVSADDSVIQGTDGWLYYMDSLDDYLGRNVLSDRAVYNVAHTLKMMQDYIEGTGRKFVFTVAPNKNSLYNENMPYYYSVKENEVSNIDKLQAVLEQEEVHYVNLHELFGKKEEILYHERDSHWNNKGAALAAEALMDALDLEHTSYENAEYEVRTDFEGDLDQMLYPNATTLEDEIYYAEPFAYEYVNEVESNFDPEIQTVNGEKTGSLLMYRDSFGNALLPFMAEEFGEAKFSRGVPYYLDDMFFCNADMVVVERAERFIPDMAENPPVMQAPLALLNYVGAGDEVEQATCETTDEGLYLKFSGIIDETLLQTDSQIYLRLDGEFTYEAFPMTVTQDGETSDYGYALYLAQEYLEGDSGKVELFVASGDEVKKVLETEVDFGAGEDLLY